MGKENILGLIAESNLLLRTRITHCLIYVHYFFFGLLNRWGAVNISTRKISTASKLDPTIAVKSLCGATTISNLVQQLSNHYFTSPGFTASNHGNQNDRFSHFKSKKRLVNGKSSQDRSSICRTGDVQARKSGV